MIVSGEGRLSGGQTTGREVGSWVRVALRRVSMHWSPGSGRRARLVEQARRGGVVGLVDHPVDAEPTELKATLFSLVEPRSWGVSESAWRWATKPTRKLRARWCYSMGLSG
jgi:hypothetical protein